MISIKKFLDGFYNWRQESDSETFSKSRDIYYNSCRNKIQNNHARILYCEAAHRSLTSIELLFQKF